MSGTASRSQTRLTYSPALRVAPVLGALGAPGDGYTAPPSALPALAGLGSLSIPASVAAPVGPPVMAGSQPFRREDGSEGGMGPQDGAMTGNPSTGSVVGDFNAVAGTFGPATGVAFSSPTNVLGATLGGLVAGGLRAAGMKEAANSVISATFGVDASQGGVKGAVDPSTVGAPPGGFGPQTGTKPEPIGYGVIGSGGGVDAGSRDEMGNPTGGSVTGGKDATTGGVANPSNVDAMGNPLGGDTGGIGGNDGGKGGVGGGQGESSPGSTDGGAKGESFMRGGYTGHGDDGVVQADQPAGTVHEGEVVIPANQVARYGLDPLLMLARGQVEPSRLMALLRG